MATAVGTTLEGPIRSFYKVHSKRAFFTYSPGRTSFQVGRLGVEPSYVEGVLHLRFPVNSPIEARKVTIRLVGKEQVQWGEAYGQYIIEHSAKSILINVEHTLWDASTSPRATSVSEGFVYDVLTELDLPFRFALLPELPSTLHIVGNQGRIIYKLIVIIHRKSSLLRFFRSDEKRVVVRCPLKRYDNFPPPLLTGLSWSVYEGPEAVQRGVGYDVALPTTNFVPGSTVVVPVRLKIYDNRVVLREIQVGIKEYRVLQVNKNRFSQKRYVTQAKLTRNDLRFLGGSIAVVVSLAIPCEKERRGEMVNGKSDKELQQERKQEGCEACVCTVTRCRCIRVSHRIKVRIRLGKCEDVKLASDCVLANFVGGELSEYPSIRRRRPPSGYNFK